MDGCAIGDGGACGPVGLRAGWPCGSPPNPPDPPCGGTGGGVGRRGGNGGGGGAGARRRAISAAISGIGGRRLPAVQLLVPDVDVGALRERRQLFDELAARERPGAVAFERHVPLNEIVPCEPTAASAPVGRRTGADGAAGSAGPGSPRSPLRRATWPAASARSRPRAFPSGRSGPPGRRRANGRRHRPTAWATPQTSARGLRER